MNNKILFLFLVLLCACSGQKKSLREFKGSYLDSAKLNFDAGMKALDDGEYDKAIGYFQFIKSKYPFSELSSLSDLKIADAKFLQSKWLDAASMYEIFVRLHPRHTEVEYASFRMALSYFNAIPSDFFILPPASSRDQSHTLEALSTIEQFIKNFPNSKYKDEALEKRLLLYSYLAKHNQHIANYYYNRGRYEAAMLRHLRVYELYSLTKEAKESLHLAAKIAEKYLSNYDLAIEIYTLLSKEENDNPYLDEAKKALARLIPLKETTPNKNNE